MKYPVYFNRLNNTLIYIFRINVQVEIHFIFRAFEREHLIINRPNLNITYFIMISLHTYLLLMPPQYMFLHANANRETAMSHAYHFHMAHDNLVQT